jgi:hypothetical protein
MYRQFPAPDFNRLAALLPRRTVASCITIVCHCKTGPSLVGARAAQQYLAAGIVDEMEINLVPTLLGSGERLFDGVGDDLHGLALVRTIATPKVTHLKFAGR